MTKIQERCVCPKGGCQKLLFEVKGGRLWIKCPRCGRDSGTYIAENVSITGPVKFRRPTWEDDIINKEQSNG